MYKALLAVAAILALSGLYQQVYAQTITVNGSTPCFMNYTAGMDLWRQCGFDQDYITFAMLPWEWITGGFFSMILVSIIILIVYQKYQKVIYPILIGVSFLPISYTLFPSVFLAWSMVMTGVGLGILVWYGFIKQSKDF